MENMTLCAKNLFKEPKMCCGSLGKEMILSKTERRICKRRSGIAEDAQKERAWA